MEPDRLEPRMSGWDKPELLGNFPLEPVGLGTVRRQGLVAVFHVGCDER